MTDFEHEVITFVGEARKGIATLEQGQRDQGERLGKLEAQFHAHEKEFANRPLNGSGWKVRAYQGGSVLAILELVRLIAAEVFAK